MLEHFHREAALRLMHELRRVLKPGGRLRIAVPDLARAMQLYQQGAKSEALDYFFTGERSGLDQHRYMYDFELLASLLAAGGFVDVQQCAYRVGRVPDLDKLDNRPAETLFVEAAKPAH